MKKYRTENEKRERQRARYARWYALRVKPLTEARRNARIPLTKKQIKERARKYAEKWRLEHPERWKEICRKASKRADEKHPIKRKRQQREAARRWRLRNPKKHLASVMRAYRNSARYAKTLARKQYYSSKEYKEQRVMGARKRASLWQKQNPDRCSARGARRRALKKNAMPKWADKKAILKVYQRAKEKTKHTGTKYVVDHYFPLTHALFSGLHVVWNLRIITQSENSKKHNTAPWLAKSFI